MAGLFDDLLDQPRKSRGGLFDDLIDAPPPKQEDRQFWQDAAEIGRQFVGGVAVDLPKMAGNVIRRVSTDGGGLDDYGKSIVESANARAAQWEPNTQGEGLISGTLAKGARGLGPMIPAAVAGMVTGPFGAGAVAAGQFGLSSAQETEDKLVGQGVPMDKATEAGWLTGAIQGPIEGIATAVGVRAFKPLAQAMGSGAAKTMTEFVSALTETAVLKPFAKGMGVNMLVQPGTEIAQDVGTEFVERSYGAKPQDAWEIAKDSAQGAIGMTALLGPFAYMAHNNNGKRAQALKFALEDETAPAELKTQAKNFVILEAKKAGVPEADISQWGILNSDSVDEAVTQFEAPLVPTNFTATPRGLIGSVTNATAGPGFNARSVVGDYIDERDFAELAQTEQRDLQVMRANIERDRIKQAELDQIPQIAAEQNQTQDVVKQAGKLDAPTAMAAAFNRLADKTIGAEPETPAAVAPEPRIVERTEGMIPMPKELAELQVDMDGGELVRIQNRNGKYAYTVIKDSNGKPTENAPDPGTSTPAASTQAGSLALPPEGSDTSVAPVGGEPDQIGVAKSVELAQKQTDDRATAYRQATSALPDGTNINGWTKQTIAGDIFWINGKRQTTDVLMEAGQAKTDAALAQVAQAPANSLPALSDIRPPKERISDTAASLSNSTKIIGNKTVPIDSLIGGVGSEVGDQARVKALAEKLSKPDAYIERLIVDDAGNVIEGQHRLDALRLLGVKDVPVVVIQDFERDFPTANVKAAITSAQKIPTDHANQLTSHLAEIYSDEKGDIAEVRKYQEPEGFEAAWAAGIDALERSQPQEKPLATSSETVETKPIQAQAPAAAQPAAAQAVDRKTLVTTPVSQREGSQRTELEAPVVEVPVADLKLSSDIPQFKEGADAKGITQRLEGPYSRALAAPVQVWQRNDGSMEVISGRHRLDLAQRSGENTIPAQVHKESDGFNQDQARMLDIELNVKDGRGKVKDYVKYFQEFGLSNEQAKAEGLLNTAIGRQAHTISHDGSESLIAAHQNNAVSDEAAVSIAQNAPGNEALQNLGMKYVADGKSINYAVNVMRSAKAAGFEGGTSGDMFGFDDSFAKEAEAVSTQATRQQSAARQQLAAIQGAAKRPELAKAGGVNVKNQKATEARIAELKQKIIDLEGFATNPDVYKQLRIDAGLAEESKPAPVQPEPEVQAVEPAPIEDPNQGGMFGLEADSPEALQQREEAAKAAARAENDKIREARLLENQNRRDINKAEKDRLAAVIIAEDKAKRDAIINADKARRDAEIAALQDPNAFEFGADPPAAPAAVVKLPVQKVTTDRIRGQQNIDDAPEPKPADPISAAPLEARHTALDPRVDALDDIDAVKVGKELGIDYKRGEDIRDKIKQAHPDDQEKALAAIAPKEEAKAEQSAEQKIRAAFSALPSVSMGVTYPITVEHNGRVQHFLARQDALGKGANYAAVHLTQIKQGRLLAGDPLGPIVNKYKLDGKNVLQDEGFPHAASDSEIKQWNDAGFDKPAQPAGKAEPSIRLKLESIAKQLGIPVTTVKGSPRMKDGFAEIPAEDTQIEGAISADHVFAHELGHGIMQKRQVSFAGFPKSEVVKRIPNYDELIAASKAYRPAIHGHEQERIRRHAMKPDEVIADAIGSVLRGDSSVEMLQPMMKSLGWTERDLGLPAQPAGKIEDFGEELKGGRKNQAPSLSKDLTDSDIATQPLSKIWPADEYLAIDDNFASAMSFAVRAIVPRKPNTAYNVARWVEKVKMARSLAQMINDGRLTRERLSQELAKTRGMSQLADKVALLESIDRSQWPRIGSVEVYPDAYRYNEDGTKTPTPLVRISIDDKSHKFDGASSIADVVERVNALLGNEAEAKRMQFEVRGTKERGFSINKKGDTEYRKLKTFETAKEAMAYVEKNYADVVAAWEAVKARDNVHEDDVRNTENRPRTGADHRNGKDATPEMFASAFAFKGVEFGNWVSQGKNAKERQGMLNQAYDALLDLADIVGVPSKALSLNGSIGLSFGSRGHGGFAAHFESDNLVINLTKTRGAGNLAHEFFHALDNYFQRGRDSKMDNTHQTRYITYSPEAYYEKTTSDGNRVWMDGGRISVSDFEAALGDQSKFRPRDAIRLQGIKRRIGDGSQWRKVDGVRPEVELRFAELVEALNASPMSKRASMNDKGADGYWGRIIERAARAFENYVISKMLEKGYQNDYLANVKDVQDFQRDKGRYPYLLPEEVAPVAEAFDNLFGTIQTKETDKGTAMYSKGETQNPTTVPALEQAIKALTGKFLGNQLGKIVATTSSEIKSHWIAQVGDVNLESEGNAGKAQAFFDPTTKTIFLIADHIEAGTEQAVAAHELMHKHGQAVLGEAGWNRLHSVIDDWYKAAPGTPERAVYDYAADRVQAIGGGEKLSSQELFPYAVEAALKFGIKPSMSAKQGTVARWLESVRQNLKAVWGKITDKPETFKAQDLVDLAFAVAQRENFDVGAINDAMTNPETWARNLPRANGEVDGRIVRDHIPNLSSIDASIANNEVLSGVRAVPLSAFDYQPGKPDQYTLDLASQIKASGEINPLIVGIDAKGPYIIEGGHRLDALIHLGAKELPARVVLDMDELGQNVAVTNPNDVVGNQGGRSADDSTPRFKLVSHFNGKPWIHFQVGESVKQMGYPGQPAKVVEVRENRHGGASYKVEIDVHDHPDGVDENGDRVATKTAWITDETLNHFNAPTAPESGGVQFSRSVIYTPKTVSEITAAIKEATTPLGAVSLWDKTVGTQYHKSTKDADFKRVFDGYVNQTDDTAHYAIEAEKLAPDVLLRLESLGDLWKGIANSGAKQKADLVAISKPLFAHIEGEKGIKQFVYDDLSLKQVFKLTPKQIEMYRQVRKAVDTSIERLAQTYAAQMGRDVGMDINRLKNMGLDDTAETVKQHIQDAYDEARAKQKLAEDLAAEGEKVKVPKAPTAEETQALIDRLDKMVKHARFLQENAYMPALRFGEYAVTVTKDGETQHFEMFESKTMAKLAAMRLAKEYPDSTIEKSVMNPQQYAMFKGVSPETVELFAKFSGVEGNEAYQDYIALSKSARSVKMRELQRKGIAGFSEDPTRVLAAFLTSNARQSSINMNIGEITDALASKTLAKKGDVQREAQKLHEYMANPLEEASRLRGFMFMHFIGGSLASAAVNLTQPVLQTAPYLSQFAGTKTARIMAAAAKAAAGGKIENAELREATKRAAEDGITEPHEIHQLMADASSNVFGGNMKARVAIKAWGSLFSLAEAFNRRLTFIAAYQTAQETKQENPYEFARKAVIETQGLYAKVNRPNWARGALGATLFTFKQFSISYVEFLTRLPTKQKALALTILVLAAGLQGLPGADDLEDLIDTIGQSLGYNTNSKKALRKMLLSTFGKDLGEILDTGVFTKSAVDVQGRLGMGNLIPGTALFKPSETSKAQTMSELAGPMGGLLMAFQKAMNQVQRGEPVGAIKEMAPVAVKNVLKGIDMASSGVYKDSKGYQVSKVDAIDSFVKMLGLQPQSVAHGTRIMSDELQDKSMTQSMESMIADRWAEGIHDKDYSKVMEARRTLKAWNEHNPESRIVINPGQIAIRVKKMNLTQKQRFIKTIPKEQRGQVAREFN